MPSQKEFKCVSISHMVSYTAEACMVSDLRDFKKYFGTKVDGDQPKIIITYSQSKVTYTKDSKKAIVTTSYQEAWDCIDNEVVSRVISKKTIREDGSVTEDSDPGLWHRGRGELLPFKKMAPKITNLAKEYC